VCEQRNHPPSAGRRIGRSISDRVFKATTPPGQPKTVGDKQESTQSGPAILPQQRAGNGVSRSMIRIAPITGRVRWDWSRGLPMLRAAEREEEGFAANDRLLRLPCHVRCGPRSTWVPCHRRSPLRPRLLSPSVSHKRYANRFAIAGAQPTSSTSVTRPSPCCSVRTGVHWSWADRRCANVWCRDGPPGQCRAAHAHRFSGVGPPGGTFRSRAPDSRGGCAADSHRQSSRSTWRFMATAAQFFQGPRTISRQSFCSAVASDAVIDPPWCWADGGLMPHEQRQPRFNGSGGEHIRYKPQACVRVAGRCSSDPTPHWPMTSDIDVELVDRCTMRLNGAGRRRIRLESSTRFSARRTEYSAGVGMGPQRDRSCEIITLESSRPIGRLAA